MPFPEAKRVIYKKNPLIEVVCQLRFPRILSINEKEPVDFQEKIRREYPLLNVQTEQEQQFTFDAVAKDSMPMPRMLQGESNKNYQFSSDDGIWRVNLTSRFLAVSTSKYTTWEAFKSRMENPLSALVSIYNPAFYERVGLRYIDAFNREELGLEGNPWHELIQPFALGLLSNPDVCEEIKGYSSIAEMPIEGGASARINTALGYVNGVNDNYTNKLSFIVDSDLYFGKIQIDDLREALETLHGTSTKLIRALITEKLHAAMEPDDYEH